MRGARERHERAVDAMDADGADDVARRKRTVKSCGPDVAVLALSCVGLISRSDGGKRAVRRGEHEVSRKAIAQGRPGCSRCTCMLVCAFALRTCTRDRGCSQHPVFPAPSDSMRAGSCQANLGQFMSRECRVIFRCHRPRRRTIQYPRDSND